MTDTALILVDYQIEYSTKESNYYLGNCEKLIERVNKLLETARSKGYKIIFIQHLENSGEEFTGKRGEIWSKLNREPFDQVIVKHKVSSFYQTHLDRELQGIKHLYIAGLMTNLCVRMLIEEAYDRDFEVHLITDCCSTLTEDVQDYTIEDLHITREGIKFLTSNKF